MFSDANIARFASIKAYKPNPNFQEDKAFTSEADKNYRKALLDKRRELTTSKQ